MTLTVNAVNDAPVAANDTYTTAEDTKLTVPAPGVLVNDTDVDSTTLTASVVAGPGKGTLTLNPDGSFTYTPNANVNGTDSFTYQVSDGSATSNTATVTLNITAVNDAPVISVPSARTTLEDTPIVFSTANGNAISVADTDAGTGPVRVTLAATKGTLTLPTTTGLTFSAGDGSSDATMTFTGTLAAVNMALNGLSYVPTSNANGTASLTISVNDQGNTGSGGAMSDSETVNITITPQNDAPVAAADTYTTAEDTPLTVPAPGVLGNDTDVDSTTLTAVLVSNPSHGTLTLNTDGSFTYTPNTNFNGTDSFTYRASDGVLQSDPTSVTLTVNAVNDAPVAANDTYTTAEDTKLTVPAPGVLVNDTDVDSTTLTASVVAGPGKGMLTLNADGSFTYTPNANVNGTDSFTYQVSDGSATSNTATVTLNITAVNDAPVAVADTFMETSGVPLTVPAPGVLANDTDPDGDVRTASLVTGPKGGMLALNTDGSFTYTPNPGFTGTDTFTYRVSDPAGAGSTATATITVAPVTVPAPTFTPYVEALFSRRALNPTRFDFYHPRLGPLLNAATTGILPSRPLFLNLAARRALNPMRFDLVHPHLGPLLGATTSGRIMTASIRGLSTRTIVSPAINNVGTIRAQAFQPLAVSTNRPMIPNVARTPWATRWFSIPILPNAILSRAKGRWFSRFGA